MNSASIAKTGKYLFIILCFAGLFSTTFSQVATKYTFSQAEQSYTAITGGTVVWSATFDDDVSDAITIPPFLFDGRQYTSLYISANGFITFGSAPIGTNYTPNSNTADYPGSVAAFGRDINQAETGTPEVRYEQVGNEFVIQWQDVRRFNIAGEIISFQIRLNTSDNSIKVVYGGTITPGSSATYPQVGLRGPSNAFATNVNNRTIAAAGGSWVNSGPGTLNSSTMYFNSTTPTTVPSVGLTFTWTPGNFAPYIDYTTLTNTTNTGSRDLQNVTIEDYDGSVALNTLAPRVYWKVGALGTWQSSATASVATPFSFTIGVAGLAVGDTVYYFVIAQDNLGELNAVPGTGLVATDVNTITTYPSDPNAYIVTLPPLSGDYTVGVTVFRSLSGKEITFEKRTRTIVIEEMTNESSINPDKWENMISSDVSLNGTSFSTLNEIPKDLIYTRTVTQDYYVPMLNGEEYKGSLLHQFTPEQIERYNLRVGGIYPTITDAVNDIVLRGMSGPVRFLLQDATYPTETFPILIGEIVGSSSVNTLTILPDVGVTTTITGSLAQPIFDLDGASNVIIDGRPNGLGTVNSLNISNTSTASNSVGIRFINGASNNTVQYVNLTGMPSGSTTRVIEFSSSASNPNGNSDNIVMNCDINGGRYSVHFNGTTANPNMNNMVSGCKVYDGTFTNFYMIAGSGNTTIENNEIYSTTGQSTANSGISLSTSATLGVNNIIGNKFYDLQNTSTSTLRGISGTPAAGSTLNIINNFISLTQDNGTKTSIYAIQLSGTTEHTANIHYNTIRLGGTHTGGTAGTIVSGGLIKSNTGATATFNAKNNISVNNRTGGTAGVVHTNFFAGSTNLVGTLDIDYNVWWADGGAGAFHSGWNGFVYNDQQAYRDSAAPHEQNTIFYNVNFVSNTDLHVAGASVGDTTLSGTPLAGITTDIDGQVRDAVRPYRGGDEGDIPLPVELASFKASVSGNVISLNWSTQSETNNKGFQVERQIGKVWEEVVFISGNGTSSAANYYAYTDKFDFKSVKGTVSYRLKQIDFDGSYSYSNTINVDVDFTPKEYTLHQNYPNPFNPSTTIKYALPYDSNVKIGVYNVLGELVTELVNTLQTTGYYTALWNAGSSASGTYFYVIQATSTDGKQEFKSVKKMLLVK